MKLNKPLYYCNECKVILPSLDKLLFVEDKSPKGFCSEACIEDFYLPLMRHFENAEQKIREALGLLEEKVHCKLSDKELVNETLSASDEIWKVANEIEEEVFTYIKHFNDFSSVLVCKVYNGEASFIFLCTITRSREFLAHVRAGEKVVSLKESAEQEEFSGGLSSEDFSFIELVESKKSKLLADLLEKRKDSDILFEEFMQYEHCFPETLEAPDEVFESSDNEGDSFFVYIKSFIEEQSNYFYIISCLKRKDGNQQASEISVFPVLAFPTNDLNLYSLFRAGKRVSGHLKN